MTRKEKLQKSLDIAIGLDRLAKSPEFIKYLRPHLEKLGTVQPLDRTNYQTDQEFIAALKENNDRSSVYLRLIKFLDDQEAIVNKIRQELEKPDITHGI